MYFRHSTDDLTCLQVMVHEGRWLDRKLGLGRNKVKNMNIKAREELVVRNSKGERGAPDERGRGWTRRM